MLERVQVPAPNPDTLQHVPAWLAGQLSGETRRAYAQDIRQFLDYLGHNNLQAVERCHIFAYRQHLAENYKPATMNRKLSTVRQLFTEAVRAGVVTKNPTEGVRGHRREEYSTTKAPSPDQVRALLDSLAGDTLIDRRDNAMLGVMARLGLRRAEVVALTVGSITEDSGKPALEVVGKGNKRRRLEIPANMHRVLVDWIEFAQLGTEDPLFQEIETKGGTHLTGRTLTTNGLYHVVKRRMEAVGIHGCSPHSLRRFLITEILSNGCSIYDAKRLAGHSDCRVTEMYDVRRHGLVDAAKYAGI